jgi:hypothetical protein
MKWTNGEISKWRGSLSLSHDARSLSVGYDEWRSSNSRQSRENQRHRLSKQIWRPTWAPMRRTLLLSLPSMIWSPIVLKDCICCEFFLLFCWFVVFCVDEFGAVACSVRVVVGFWVRWLAVGPRFFGWLKVGLV